MRSAAQHSVGSTLQSRFDAFFDLMAVPREQAQDMTGDFERPQFNDGNRAALLRRLKGYFARPLILKFECHLSLLHLCLTMYQLLTFKAARADRRTMRQSQI